MTTADRTLAAATSPGLPALPTVLVPLGSTEQHGPHLPLDTDTVIAAAVVQGAVDSLADRGYEAMAAPAISYGSSGEHQDFSGTSSIGTRVLHDLVVELTRSMSEWAGRIVFVNGHGGNIPALGDAVGQMAAEGHQVAWLPCATEEFDLHAGRTETSLMLHLAPWNVRISRAEAGNTGTIEELLPLMIDGGVKAVSVNGVLGDPAGATAAEGAELLTAMVAAVTAFVARMP